MSHKTFTAKDYPIADRQPEETAGDRGKTLSELTLEEVVQGDVVMEDLRITARTLYRQAEIARSVGRASLAANFERAAEMTALPQDVILRIYEVLRPGRVTRKSEVLEAADALRSKYHADALAEFVESAAHVYEDRKVFRVRY